LPERPREAGIRVGEIQERATAFLFFHLYLLAVWDVRKSILLG
jgi:hypothetical protein